MLKPVLDYSKEELGTASEACPAIKRYLQSIQNFEELGTLSHFKSLNLVESFNETITLLRQQLWLNCALATYFENNSAEDICNYWSHEVDKIILHSWNYFELNEEPLILVALGKLGALELNLSSDVDLVILSKDNHTKKQIQKIQSFTRALTEINPYGFCFRVDYNLRPGGSYGPLVSSFHQFQDYYWSQGETWERLALGRFRIITDPHKLCELIYKIKDKFCFRKFIDYRLFDDLKNIRKQIHEHNFKNNDSFNFDLKLGKGGIRDIELFLHALQVIHGGRIPSIKTVSTSELNERLCEHNLIDSKLSKKLINYYWSYRMLENKIQIYEDQQIHTWSSSCNYPTLNNKATDALKLQSKEVDQIVSDLLGPILSEKNPLPQTLENQKTWLNEHHFDEFIINDVWPQLIELTARSVRGQKDEAIRKNFLFYFVEDLKKINFDHNLGLSLLLDFIKSTRVKASFFSLLTKERSLMLDLVTIFSVSPYLGNIITSRPEILDNFFLNAQADFSAEEDVFLEQLAERKLLSEIISSKEFLKSKNISELSNSLSSNANIICIHLLKFIKSKLKSDNIEILSLGKWGGSELGLKSDLDFIFVCFEEPTEIDFKTARRFLSRLSDQHKGGNIFEVDLRLRPTGKAGPLIVSWHRLIEYLENEAETWALQSYLKSRFINDEIDEKFRPLIIKAILKSDFSRDSYSEIIRIKNELNVKSDENSVDLKYTKGGLIDIEFCLQILILKNKFQLKGSSVVSMLQVVEQSNSSKKDNLSLLMNNYIKIRTIEQLYQLLSDQSGTQILFNSKNFLKLTKLLQIAPDVLKNDIISTFSDNIKNLQTIDPKYFSI